MTTDLPSLLPVALRAADIAGKLLPARRPAALAGEPVRGRDAGPEVERAVRGYLAEQTPDIAFRGARGSPGDGGAGGWAWALGPVDGASNLARRIPLCAVSLALLRDGRPVLAVIDAPFLRERYHAIDGHGAHSGRARLRASAVTRLRDAVVAIGGAGRAGTAQAGTAQAGTEQAGPGRAGTGHERNAVLAAAVALSGRAQQVRMLGTAALDLAWVAAGRLDAAIVLAGHPFATAAGALVAREAGAAVTDPDGAPYSLASPAAVAAAPGLTSQLVTLIAAAGGVAGAGAALPSPGTMDGALGRARFVRARYLIFDFDGPVCDLAAALPDDLADQIYNTLRMSGAEIPPAVASARDARVMLTRAAAISPPLASRIDREIAGIEKAATARADVTGSVHETFAACRDSGRVPAVVSGTDTQTAAAYLGAHGLDDHVQHVTGVPGYPPGHLVPPAELLAAAIGSLGAAPGECAVITASADMARAAIDVGSQSIGYARTVSAERGLAEAGSAGVVASLADLAIALRARPLHARPMRG